MISRFFSSMSIKFPIQVTNEAWNKIESIMKQSSNNIGFIFSASSGGCNGFNYNLNLLDDNKFEKLNNKLKLSYVNNNNTKIYIDPLSEFYLIGTKIDYISEDFNNNIFENKFIFIPDKEKATSCGCGISFSPKSM